MIAKGYNTADWRAVAQHVLATVTEKHAQAACQDTHRETAAPQGERVRTLERNAMPTAPDTPP